MSRQPPPHRHPGTGDRAILRFATRNLLVKKVRTSLAIFGLSISILQIVTLLGMSRGLKELVASTFEMVDGMIVLNEETLSPMLSSLDAGLEDRIEAIPGVVGALPEVWNLAWKVEGRQPFKRGLMTGLMLLSYDPADRFDLTDNGFFEQRLVEGRHLEKTDEILISRTVARDYKKAVGDTISVVGHRLAVTGIFQSHSVLTDNIMVIHIDRGRFIRSVSPEKVSIYFVETDPSVLPDTVIARSIERELADVGVKALTKQEANVELTWAFQRLDLFILFVSLFAVCVGALGVLNTMLMSVLERTQEFGILKATGWEKGNVLRLVLLESVSIGLIGGVIGCIGGYILVHIGGSLLDITPVVEPWLIAGSFALAVLLGVLGGIYPANRAARMSPMEAIRSG